MNPDELLAKARRALESALILQAAGDPDGACNRAYYAMFDAAKAALVATASDGSSAKTHSGLISAFSKRFVATGGVARELGKAFNRVGELRQAADYTGAPLPNDKAAWALTQAENFVAAVELLLRGRMPSP